MEKQFSKGHVNFYNENHVGIVYNGFSISLHPSALYKQLCLNKDSLDKKITGSIKALPEKTGNGN